MQHELIQTFRHPISDISYQVSISIPTDRAPKEGFPVLYVLDGNAYGTLCREIVKIQSRRAEKTGVSPMIIVSIGYAVNDIFPSLRVYDFTPASAAASLPPKPDGASWPTHGGAKEFLDFLETIVQPFVYQSAPVNPHNQILFGHSLGGLFVLNTLFERPNLFRNYICFSPSIWWNDKEILNKERADFLMHDRNLFIAAERTEKMDMHENAFLLFQRLQVNNPRAVAFRSPTGENHMSIVPTVLSDALRYLFSR
ncbi:alpha/beta hydrolase-fold protein [Oceanobacillus profundus]|uniref:alpha/beta hydrolase n=1 Tax=Oceanobacillus TaxID=182709 RepID=UPI0026E3F4DE|nr:alpha/beta hydrolase-fold protein [Oceanobacillus profundus]MBR3118706.1 alpha/beta hydrolase [Oceanobacillus sp.]MDO6450986.1 alpha/beta hydrolase-fold protein [Oceanobacillus profundus]